MSAPAPAVDATWRALLAAAVDVRAHTQCCSDQCGWYCRVPTEYLDALQRCAEQATEATR
jgi:hypothetical protein